MLESKKYFGYPDTEYVSCLGLSPRGAKGWVYQPTGLLPDVKSKSVFSSFEAAVQYVQKLAREAEVELPAEFGQVRKREFKCLTIKRHAISLRLRYVDPTKRTFHQPSFKLQFNGDSIASFTSAVKTAYKIKGIIDVMQFKPELCVDV